MQRLPMKRWSPTITGAAMAGSRTPPIPTPPDRWTLRPISGAPTEGRPRIDHRARTDHACRC